LSQKDSKTELFLYSSTRNYVRLATQAYCVKCKAKRDMKDEKQVTMKNGQGALSGICTVCGTKMFKIGGGSKKIAKAKAASKKPTIRTAKVKAKSTSKRK
jgi:Domain of unknown function (DUF5679)